MKLLIPVFVLLILTHSAFGQVAEVGTPEYETWIKPYRSALIHSGSSRRAAEGEADPPFGVITVVTQATGDSAWMLASMSLTTGFVARRSGAVESFSRRTLGFRSGCCGQMTADEVSRAKQILSDLPSDGGRLPPNGRRILVQKAGAGAIDARVYDLAFVPDKVLELLRLTQTNIGSYVPTFQPESTVSDVDHSDLRGFAVAGDGRFAVTTRGHSSLRVRRFLTTKGASQDFEEIKLPPNAFFPRGLTLSPDESTLIAGAWGDITFFDTREWRVVGHIKVPVANGKLPNYTGCRFIERGKYLLFDGGGVGTRVFETGSWREVKKPESIPNDALFYLDSPDARRAVFQLDKKLYLRSVDQKIGTLFSLDDDELINASFSPDGTRLVIVTNGKLRRGENSRRLTRIRIWDANELRQTHGLMPFEQDRLEEVYGIDWIEDGKYFLAAAKAEFSNAGIEIWDASSGRHIGELSGCVGALSGMTRLSDGKIAAGCSHGKIRIWDLAASLREIEKFRRSGTGSEK